MTANLSQWIITHFLSITLRVVFSGSERDGFDKSETMIAAQSLTMFLSLFLRREDKAGELPDYSSFNVDDVGIILMPEKEINDDFQK